MKATCPNDPTHQRFVTVAHVSEDWVVDASGEWVETLATLDVTHKPDSGNTWTCHTCGAEAEVTSG